MSDKLETIWYQRRYIHTLVGNLPCHSGQISIIGVNMSNPHICDVYAGFVWNLIYEYFNVLIMHHWGKKISDADEVENEYGTSK